MHTEAVTGVVGRAEPDSSMVEARDGQGKLSCILNRSASICSNKSDGCTAPSFHTI